MRVEQHGDAAAAQLLEQRPHGAAAGGVERARRLVEQQQARRADQRLGEPEPLLHALGHRPDPAPAGVGEPDELEQLARARPRRPSEPASFWCSTSSSSARAPVGEAEQLGEVAERRGAPRSSRRGAPHDRGGPGGRRARARRRSSRASTCPRRWGPAARRARPRRPRGRRRGAPRSAVGLVQAETARRAARPTIVPDGAHGHRTAPALGRHPPAHPRPDRPAGEEVVLTLSGAEDTAEAIKRLAVRGAPLIGVAAAYGLAMEVAADPTPEALERGRRRCCAGARPTARNLALGGGARAAAALGAPGRHRRRRARRGRGDPPRGRGGQRRARPPRRRRARGRARRRAVADDPLQLRRARRVAGAAPGSA